MASVLLLGWFQKPDAPPPISTNVRRLADSDFGLIVYTLHLAWDLAVLIGGILVWEPLETFALPYLAPVIGPEFTHAVVIAGVLCAGFGLVLPQSSHFRQLEYALEQKRRADRAQ